MLVDLMPRLMPPGPVKGYPQKPNGNLPLVVD